MKQLKIVIEKHTDGYVAYPVGIKGVVVGEGSSFDEALRDVQSALQFHLDTFGAKMSSSGPTRSEQSQGWIRIPGGELGNRLVSKSASTGNPER